jgi:hypothetical protein
VQQVIGGFERVPGVMAATNPDQLRELDASRGGRDRIEGVVGVDVGADFKLGSGCGQQGMDERGAAGAFRAEDFRDSAARETLSLSLCEQSIQRRDAGGEAFPDFRVRAQSKRSDASGVWVHAISPFLRLSYFAHLQWSCQER